MFVKDRWVGYSVRHKWNDDYSKMTGVYVNEVEIPEPKTSENNETINQRKTIIHRFIPMDATLRTNIANLIIDIFVKKWCQIITIWTLIITI